MHTLEAAYTRCERLARLHYENFPVASRLLPRSMRPHVAAVYAFARTADDFADEDARPSAERQRLLDDWRLRLYASLNVREAAETNGPDADLIFAALGDTIRRFRIPVTLFEDLLSAFRQDTMTVRYGTWADVLDYCHRSANPVGRIVLRIAGYDDAALDTSSDGLCSALQLTNFWQDLAIDWQRGRLYMPQDEYTAAGADPADLDAARLTPAWQRALRGAAQRTRALFREGRAVCGGVRGRVGFELRLTWAGGTRVLDRLERGGFDVFQRRPRLDATDVPALVRDALLFSATCS
jgi:squalene synthase HpnC